MNGKSKYMVVANNKKISSIINYEDDATHDELIAWYYSAKPKYDGDEFFFCNSDEELDECTARIEEGE